MVEFLRKIDAPVLDELVIALPKISLDRVSKTLSASSLAHFRPVGGNGYGRADH